MPSACGCSRVSATGVTTGSHERRGRGSTSVTASSAGPSSGRPSPGSSSSIDWSAGAQLSQNGASSGSAAASSAAAASGGSSELGVTVAWLSAQPW